MEVNVNIFVSVLRVRELKNYLLFNFYLNNNNFLCKKTITFLNKKFRRVGFRRLIRAEGMSQGRKNTFKDNLHIIHQISLYIDNES